MDFLIGAEEAGLCVRDCLRRRLHPSAKLMTYLKYRENGICVNGEHCTVRKRVVAGDILSVTIEDDGCRNSPEPVELPLTVLYEDAELVVPSKPAGMPTHPSHDHYRDTVANALAFRYRSAGVPFVFRPVNRLDRNTSGLLLAARNRLSAARLTASLQMGKIHKTYLAILDGELPVGSGVIDVPLHRTAASIIVREVCKPDTPDADPARTEYTVLSSHGGHSLVEARPITGRTHQLRVHFASLGHPITGDDLYGTPSPLIGRQALHAYRLSFPHPVTGEILTLTAPPADDFSVLLSLCFPEVKP